MLKILERRITLQLLVFYGLFVLPLLLGGVELYFFQRDALQQSAQQADLNLAQAIALEVETDHTISRQELTARLVAIRQHLTNSSETRIWIVDSNGRSIADTAGSTSQINLLDMLPGLRQALHGKSGSMIASEQGRDWLYSYVPVAGTGWAVAVQRPTDVTFAVVISFQHSLIIALVMLIAGATVFWFVMHGWVVAPLSRLAKAVTMIKPDQTKKVADSRLLAKDRSRNDEIGKLIAAFSTMEDEIHALFRKSDEKSQKRLHTLDAIMRSVDEAILLESPQGQVVYANHSFTQLVGISPQEVLLDLDSFADSHLAEKLMALLEDPAAYTEAVQKAEQGSGPHVIEFQVRGYYNQAGQWVPGRRDIRMRLFHVRDLAGQLIGRGKIFNDVTQQNEAEQVKKNLLAIVSHELRTPLTAIKGYATSLLETDVELDAALQRHFLQNIVAEGDRMADLVTSLLAMSQLEAGTLKLYPGLCRLDALIEQVIPEDERGCVRVDIPEDLPLLYIDRRRIEVVLCNLLENARRHGGADASVEISARYEPHAPGEGFYLSVADNGPGFPPHLAERIFDRFYQVDSGTKRSSSGVGLGLAICRGFIEAHGGRIWAENRTDGVRGAIFHIWLPPKLLHTPGAQSSSFELQNSM
ncbi:MAG TPA: ATP-binding protein [Ktedonobacteraceae bacterium]|nr:ATP-binding protein [Ktedonobacteraceae bacterium]